MSIPTRTDPADDTTTGANQQPLVINAATAGTFQEGQQATWEDGSGSGSVVHDPETGRITIEHGNRLFTVRTSEDGTVIDPGDLGITVDPDTGLMRLNMGETGGKQAGDEQDAPEANSPPEFFTSVRAQAPEVENLALRPTDESAGENADLAEPLEAHRGERLESAVTQRLTPMEPGLPTEPLTDHFRAALSPTATQSGASRQTVSDGAGGEGGADDGANSAISVDSDSQTVTVNLEGLNITIDPTADTITIDPGEEAIRLDPGTGRLTVGDSKGENTDGDGGQGGGEQSERFTEVGFDTGGGDDTDAGGDGSGHDATAQDGGDGADTNPDTEIGEVSLDADTGEISIGHGDSPITVNLGDDGAEGSVIDPGDAPVSIDPETGLLTIGTPPEEGTRGEAGDARGGSQGGGDGEGTPAAPKVSMDPDTGTTTIDAGELGVSVDPESDAVTIDPGDGELFIDPETGKITIVPASEGSSGRDDGDSGDSSGGKGSDHRGDQGGHQDHEGQGDQQGRGDGDSGGSFDGRGSGGFGGSRGTGGDSSSGTPPPHQRRPGGEGGDGLPYGGQYASSDQSGQATGGQQGGEDDDQDQSDGENDDQDTAGEENDNNGGDNESNNDKGGDESGDDQDQDDGENDDQDTAGEENDNNGGDESGGGEGDGGGGEDGVTAIDFERVTQLKDNYLATLHDTLEPHDTVFSLYNTGGEKSGRRFLLVGNGQHLATADDLGSRIDGNLSGISQTIDNLKKEMDDIIERLEGSRTAFLFEEENQKMNLQQLKWLLGTPSGYSESSGGSRGSEFYPPPGYGGDNGSDSNESGTDG